MAYAESLHPATQWLLDRLLRGRRKKKFAAEAERLRGLFADDTFDVDVKGNNPSDERMAVFQQAADAEHLRPGEGWKTLMSDVRGRQEFAGRPGQQVPGAPGAFFLPSTRSFGVNSGVRGMLDQEDQTLRDRDRQDFQFEQGLLQRNRLGLQGTEQEDQLTRMMKQFGLDQQLSDHKAGIADAASARDFGEARALSALGVTGQKDVLDHKDTLDRIARNATKHEELTTLKPGLEHNLQEGADMLTKLDSGELNTGLITGYMGLVLRKEDYLRIQRLGIGAAREYLDKYESRPTNFDFDKALDVMVNAKNPEAMNVGLLKLHMQNISLTLAELDRLNGVSEEEIQAKYGNLLRGLTDEELNNIKRTYDSSGTSSGLSPEAAQFYEGAASQAPPAPRLDPFLNPPPQQSLDPFLRRRR